MPNAPRCLVVDLPRTALSVGLTQGATVSFVAVAELVSHLQPPTLPDLVVAPLFSAEFDVIDIIEILRKAGYRGTLRVVTPRLPNRQIVLRELRLQAVRHGITLELVETEA